MQWVRQRRRCGCAVLFPGKKIWNFGSIYIFFFILHFYIICSFIKQKFKYIIRSLNLYLREFYFILNQKLQSFLIHFKINVFLAIFCSDKMLVGNFIQMVLCSSLKSYFWNSIQNPMSCGGMDAMEIITFNLI